MDAELEVIDALIDGESVDASALKEALTTPEGRSYLVDAWLLRSALVDDGVPTIGSSSERPRQVDRTRRSAMPWVVAASLAAALAGGVAIGRTTAGLSTRPVESPQATTASAVEPTPGPVFPVPAPTRVIQLEFHAAPGKSGGD